MNEEEWWQYSNLWFSCAAPGRISGLQKQGFTVACSMSICCWQALQFLLLLPVLLKSLSACIVWKSGRETLEPRICSGGHFSVKHNPALLILQMDHRQRFKLIHFICERTHVPHYGQGKRWFELYLSAPLPSSYFTSTVSSLLLTGDLESQSGYTVNPDFDSTQRDWVSIA